MTTRKISTGVIIALAATAIFLALVTAGLIVTQTIPSSGTVTKVNVGVYLDDQCTQNCTSISWGTIYPDDTINRTIYVINTGTVPITLAMTEENWDPTDASDYLTLTWDQEGKELAVGESISANLTLSAVSDTGDLTNFSVDIVIAGAE